MNRCNSPGRIGRLATALAALLASTAAQALDPVGGLVSELGSAGLGAVTRGSRSPYIGAGQRNDLVPLYLYEGDRAFLHATRGGIKLQDDGQTIHKGGQRLAAGFCRLRWSAAA
ncbi:MAG TPA: hypothetical protein PLI90_10380 [Rhodocyclaceae bacterium]|nr:hypothetical protein [Rhodocyclaceae bacterium]